MKKIFLTLILLVNILHANIKEYFPKLEGRVIDKAELLSNTTKNNLNTILYKHEQESSNQIVVVTLNSLNGYDISDFTYQLGRYWEIGQKDKNNGVILLISIEERKIRIDVGYGLEGSLTDKIAHEIIEYKLKPKFKINDFDSGVLEATNEIIKVIKGEYKNRTGSKNFSKNIEEILVIIYFIIIFISVFINVIAKKLRNKLVYKISKSSKISSFFGFFSFILAQEYTNHYVIVSVLIFLILLIFNIKTSKDVDFDKLQKTQSNDEYSNFKGFSSSSNRISRGFSGAGGSFGGGGASGGW